MKDVTWKEAAQACNSVFKKYHNNKVDDYIQECCMNALPHGLTQCMATALSVGLTNEDSDVKVMVNAYQQLSEKGFIGTKP